ncbi:MAG: ABC transporter permease [Lachnospiraceae bacterium]|nr:ABC transporter permease [Lachnospiraceae bacterium]
MEMNKMMRILPRMLLQAILLMVLIGTIAFCGVKSMEKEPLAVGVDIAVVVREDNAVTQMAIGFVENMESVSEFCTFRQVSEEEGFSLLGEGEVAALILLPEQLVEGIMNGENPAVEIYFAKQAGLEAMLFKELTDAGAGLLNVAQAEIYGAGDTAAAYGFTDKLSVMEMEIDSYNLAFALDRLALYETEQLSVTGQMSVLQYFAASAAVLFLLLFGMALYPVMQPEPAVFRKQLSREGVGFLWQDFCQWLCGLLSVGLMSILLLPAVRLAKVWMAHSGQETELFRSVQDAKQMTETVVLILLGMVLVSTFIYCLYSLAGSRISGILMLFVVSLMMIYLSGGLVPSVFLPEMMQKIGGRLPTGYLIRAAGSIFVGYRSQTVRDCVSGMCLYTVLLGGLACLCRRRYVR